MRTQWNTRRMYSSEGQRIVAETCENGVLFNDIDRHVMGIIPLVVRPRDGLHLEQLVMANYDQNNYQYDPRAEKLEWRG